MSNTNALEIWLVNIRNANTKRQYQYWFKRFLAFAKEKPDNLVLKGETRKGILELDTLVKKFYAKLIEEGYAQSSSYQIMNIIRSFFAYNLVRFPKVPKSFAPTGPDFEQRKDLSKEEFQKMLNSTNSDYEKLILCFLAETGQRRGILTALKIKHNKEDLKRNTPVVIHVPEKLLDNNGINVVKVSIKDGYRFGLTGKTVNMLIDHLNKRKLLGEELTEESWLLADKTGNPIYGDKIGRIVIRCARIAEIQKFVKSGKLGRIAAVHAHTFRSYLKSRMKEAGITDELFLNMILAHKQPYASAYDRFTDEQIKAAYTKAESFLT